MVAGQNQQFTRLHLIAIKNTPLMRLGKIEASIQTKGIPQTIVVRWVEKDLQVEKHRYLATISNPRKGTDNSVLRNICELDG